MKRIPLPLLLIAASAVLMGIGAVACGGDSDDGDDSGAATATPNGGGTAILAAYLTEVTEVQEGVSAATDTMGEEVFSDPELARQSLSAAIDLAESSVAALEAMDPPDDAMSAHEALLAAGKNLVADIQVLFDELQGMEDGAAFDALAADTQAPGSELSKAIDELVSACEGLQALSAEFKTGVELACPAPNP